MVPAQTPSSGKDTSFHRISFVHPLGHGLAAARKRL